MEPCGQNRFKLCTPCEPNTYTDVPLSWSCKPCTRCIGMVFCTYSVLSKGQDSSKSLDMTIERLLPNSVLHHNNTEQKQNVFVFNVSLLMPLLTEPQVQLKPCSADADTVCGCKSGLRCGNQRCEYCVQECRKGQEPTDNSMTLFSNTFGLILFAL